MLDPRILLDDGQLWKGWGPAADDVSSQLVGVLAGLKGLPRKQVRDALTHSEDRGRYLLVKRLSMTSHAVVYLAVDRVLARKVIVKIHLAKGKATKESQVAAWFNHPNVIQIHDFGKHSSGFGSDDTDTWPYSVFELCKHDLVEYCHKQPGPHWTEIVRRHLEAGRGLMYLHDAGYAHRDFKPSNVLVVNGIAKIADFGSVEKIGEPVEFDGTAGFVAPEIGNGPTAMTDLFAFAVSLWLCLYGDLPYAVPSGPNVSVQAAILSQIEKADNHEITPPRSIPPGLPESVRKLLERALHPDPEKRPTWDELTVKLQVTVEQDERRQLRRSILVAAGVVSIVTLGAGFGIGARYYRGTGAGSLYDVTLAAFDDPLTRAEIAAAMGDGPTALEEIYKLHQRKDAMSKPELERSADRISRIAETLRAAGMTDEANVASGVAVYFGNMARKTKPPQHENR